MSEDVNMNRRISGRRNENRIISAIRMFTDCVYHNIYLPTSLVKKSTTEIDIVFFLFGTIFIIETKNILALEGALDKQNWLISSRSGHYKAYNPIAQNKMHTRVFKNRFFERFGYFPNVISMVVVPDGVLYEDDMVNEIMTLTEFTDVLRSVCGKHSSHLKYQFISFMEERM